MRLVLYITVLLIMTACSTSHIADNKMHTSLINSQQQNAEKDVFVAVKSHDLNYPREEEKMRLRQISSLIIQTLPLITEAQEKANYNARVVFDYDALVLDLQAIQFGLNQYFLTNIRSPRIPRQINDYSVKGNYIEIKR